MKYPNLSKNFVLATDASKFAIGAVLSQDGHPISFASRTLNDHETHYHTMEKELLAIIWTTKYFRTYLFGRRFTIRTDHKPLQWLHNLKEPNLKMQRWKIQLDEFNYDIEHLSGKENYVADALSRIKINNIIEVNEDIKSTDATIHSADEDNSELIPITEYLLNAYKIQMIIQKDDKNEITIEKVRSNRKDII